jgi:peptidoglycan/LPS O-acetylase OafA/YrhL
MNFLGKISYGIYVIHPLLIFLFSKILNHLAVYDPLKYVVVYGIIIGATILLSYLSFKHMESYFLVFKKRFEVVKSSPSKILEQ